MPIKKKVHSKEREPIQRITDGIGASFLGMSKMDTLFSHIVTRVGTPAVDKYAGRANCTRFGSKGKIK